MCMHTPRGLNCFSLLVLFKGSREDSNASTFFQLTIISFIFHCYANGLRNEGVEAQFKSLYLEAELSIESVIIDYRAQREIETKRFLAYRPRFI